MKNDELSEVYENAQAPEDILKILKPNPLPVRQADCPAEYIGDEVCEACRITYSHERDGDSK